MTNEKIPGIQLQGDTGIRQLVPLPDDNVVKQYQKRKALTGVAYLPLDSKIPYFSEHDDYCRLYVDDATAVRAVIELSASKYGVPLVVSGDPKLCSSILAAAKEMGVQVNSNSTVLSAKPETTSEKHPIPDTTLVLFTPNSKDQNPIEGRIISSTTVDQKVYRYRIALQPDGAQIASVYTDAGEFQVVDNANINETHEVNESPINDEAESSASSPAWMMTKAQYVSNQQRMRLDLNMVNPGYKVDCDYISPGVAGPFTTNIWLANKPNVGGVLQAEFGDATVKRVSAVPQDISEHELILAGKQHHRRIIVDAIMMGKPVPEIVKSDYLEVWPIINDWVKSQLDSAIPLPPSLYNEMQSVRGGVIYVRYNEQDDSYDVSHLINGELHNHVAGVDIEGAQEAAQNLLGIVSIKKLVEPTVLAAPSVKETQHTHIGVNLLRTIDIDTLLETTYEAGETDFIGAIQASIDDLVEQANLQILSTAQTNMSPPNNLNKPLTELRLQEWKDTLAFMGEDPAAVAENCKSVVIERDELKNRVADLEARILIFVDKSEPHEFDEIEQE